MPKLVRGLSLAAALTAVAVALSVAPAQDKGKKADKDKAAGGAVEVYKDKAGEFRFRIKGPDGKSIAIATKGYDTKADAVKALGAIKEILATSKVTEVTDDKGK